MPEGLQLFLEQYSLFSEYFSPLAVLWSIVKFIALGFILALGVIIFCVKFNLFQRRNRYWNIAAKLYFLYIPVIFIGVSIPLGALQYQKDVNDKVINFILSPVKQGVVKELQKLPPKVQNHLSFYAILQSAILAIQFGDTATEGDLINIQSSFFMKWLLNSITDSVLDKLNTKISDFTGADKETVNRLWKQNAIELFESNFLDDLLSYQIHKKIHSFQKILLFILLLLLSIPMTDTLIAKKLEKRRCSNTAYPDCADA